MSEKDGTAYTDNFKNDTNSDIYERSIKVSIIQRSFRRYKDCFKNKNIDKVEIKEEIKSNYYKFFSESVKSSDIIKESNLFYLLRV